MDLVRRVGVLAGMGGRLTLGVVHAKVAWRA